MKTAFYFDNTLDSEIRGKIHDFRAMLELYGGGKPMASGRGTSRIVEIGGKRFILKKEARGGMAARFLPDSFFSLEKFDGEWLIQELACSMGLSVPLLARWEVPGSIFLTDIYTMTAFIEECVSLKELIISDNPGAERLEEAGGAVAKLHRKGVYHGDLNCGNILFTNDGARLIDFKGSYLFSAPLPEKLARRNILRLMRSLSKERVKAGREPKSADTRRLLDGYLAERNESWVETLASAKPASRLRLWSYGTGSRKK